jgi:hypothetical protein
MSVSVLSAIAWLGTLQQYEPHCTDFGVRWHRAWNTCCYSAVIFSQTLAAFFNVCAYYLYRCKARIRKLADVRAPFRLIRWFDNLSVSVLWWYGDFPADYRGNRAESVNARVYMCTAVPAWVTSWVTFLQVLVLLHGSSFLRFD